MTRTTELMVGGLLVVGLGMREAMALPIRWIEAFEAQDQERIYPVPEEDGAHIDLEGQVIVVRHEDHLFAFSLACPHQGTALRWQDRQQRFRCPQHDSRFEIDGTFIDGRATRHMDRFAVHLNEDTLVVNLAKRYRSDEQAEAWQEAKVALGPAG